MDFYTGTDRLFTSPLARHLWGNCVIVLPLTRVNRFAQLQPTKGQATTQYVMLILCKCGVKRN